MGATSVTDADTWHRCHQRNGIPGCRTECFRPNPRVPHGLCSNHQKIGGNVRITMRNPHLKKNRVQNLQTEREIESP